MKGINIIKHNQEDTRMVVMIINMTIMVGLTWIVGPQDILYLHIIAFNHLMSIMLEIVIITEGLTRDIILQGETGGMTSHPGISPLFPLIGIHKGMSILPDDFIGRNTHNPNIGVFPEENKASNDQ